MQLMELTEENDSIDDTNLNVGHDYLFRRL